MRLLFAVGLLGAVSQTAVCQQPIDYTALAHEARGRADARAGELKACLQAAEVQYWATWRINGEVRADGTIWGVPYSVRTEADRDRHTATETCFREYGPVDDPALAVLPKGQP